MNLSILIPARNEMFLSRTIEDALKNIEAETEIIAILDGEWAEPPIPQHERVNIIYTGEPIGQRASTNLGAKLSKAKYVMKVDAHCSFDKGFDRKMLEVFKQVGEDAVMVPTMRNLWAFDWKCYHCGWKKYQGPTPEKCENCGKTDKLRKKMIWIGKETPQSNSYSFDAEPHFQYFREFNRRPEGRGDLTETMSLQGSCFMCTREKYWDLGLCDEKLGNWGNQGIEVALKAWLSGGRVLVNHNTWYAHMFRTQGGDFSFPWPNSGKETQRTKENVRDLLWNKKWPKQKYPVSWLVEKFWPVPGWTEEDLNKLKRTERGEAEIAKQSTNARLVMAIKPTINADDNRTKLLRKKCVIIPVDDPTPIAYMNVYEEGDIWVKTRGCDECPLEDRLYCCGNCAMLLEDTGQCRLHIDKNRTDKPIYCIMKPFPDDAKGRCVLEYECIKGKNKGKIRRLKDKQPLLCDK